MTPWTLASSGPGILALFMQESLNILPNERSCRYDKPQASSKVCWRAHGSKSEKRYICIYNDNPSGFWYQICQNPLNPFERKDTPCMGNRRLSSSCTDTSRTEQLYLTTYCIFASLASPVQEYWGLSHQNLLKRFKMNDYIHTWKSRPS